MNLEDLKKEFKPNELSWRIGRSGKTNNQVWATCLVYIDARAVQERLDQVCGPENWSVKYQIIDNKAVICDLSIKTSDGWITKSDGAEMTDVEAFKGGISSAFKRAASAWGIGRYLHSIEEGPARIVDRNFKDANYAKLGEKFGYEAYYWVPPQMLAPSPLLEEKKIQVSPQASPQVQKVADELEHALAKPSQPESTNSVDPKMVIPKGKFQGKTLLDALNEDSKQGFSYAKYLSANLGPKPSEWVRSYVDLAKIEKAI